MGMAERARLSLLVLSSVFMLLAVSGCGADCPPGWHDAYEQDQGSGLEHAPLPADSDETYYVRVMNRYIQGADVWLDLDANESRDAGEPQAVSDAEGVAALRIGDQPSSPIETPRRLLAHVAANRALHTDAIVHAEPALSRTIERTYTMRAPWGSKVISPLTTLVSADMATHGRTQAQSEAALIAALGYAGDHEIGGDYLAAGDVVLAAYADEIVKFLQLEPSGFDLMAYFDEVIAQVRVAGERAALLRSDELKHVRVTISEGEWQALGLDLDRSTYHIDAHGDPASYEAAAHHRSELYRRADFELVDAEGDVVDRVANVGFRIRGNTSRKRLEGFRFAANGAVTTFLNRPHFSIKFDETFDGDESVYACVDEGGEPASVADWPCLGRVSQDIPTMHDNDGRQYRALESLILRFNKTDPTYTHEWLAHDLLARMGVPVPEMSHATLTVRVVSSGDPDEAMTIVNEYDMGVYLLMEPVDDQFVRRRFANNHYLFKVKGGDLSLQGTGYGPGPDPGSGNAPETDPALAPECTPYRSRADGVFVAEAFCRIGVEVPDPMSRAEWLGPGHDDAAVVNGTINGDWGALGSGTLSQFYPYDPNYDLKSKKKQIATARERLLDFMHFLAQEPDMAALEARFDVDSYVRAQAVDAYIGATDHYTRVANNYYLYLEPSSDRWIYIPVDYDFAFRDCHPVSWPAQPAFCNLAKARFTLSSASAPAWRETTIDDDDSDTIPGIGSELDYRILDRLIFSSAMYRDRYMRYVEELSTRLATWPRIGQKARARMKRIADRIVIADAVNDGPDVFAPEALDGCGYFYTDYVNPANPRSSTMGGSLPAGQSATVWTDDTMKRFMIRRQEVAAEELALYWQVTR